MTVALTTAPASPAARLAAALAAPRSRYRLYVAVAITFYLLAWAAAALKAHANQQPIDFLITDGRGYYVYLPSLVIDGDLDFLNQARQQYGHELPSWVRIEIDDDGRLRNKWPVGVALTIAPSFLVAHGLSHALHAITGSDAFAPNGFTVLYPLFNVAYIMAVGALGMVLIDRLAVRRCGAPGWAVAAGVLTFWVGTNYAWYYFRDPFMAHVVSAAWVCAVVVLFDRIGRAMDERRVHPALLAAMTFAAAMAVVCRYTNVFVFPFFVYLLVRLVRERQVTALLKATPLCLLALAPLLVHYLIRSAMTGDVTQASVQDLGYQPRERFYWTSPALFSTLFSSRHGLFFWSPAYLLAAWGVLWHTTQRRGWRDPLLVCLLLGAAMLWYVNSAWYAWWFGPAVGGRAFLDLAPLFILGFVFAFQWLGRRGPRTWAVVAVALASGVGVNYLLMALRMLGRIDADGYLLGW